MSFSYSRRTSSWREQRVWKSVIFNTLHFDENFFKISHAQLGSSLQFFKLEFLTNSVEWLAENWVTKKTCGPGHIELRPLLGLYLLRRAEKIHTDFFELFKVIPDFFAKKKLGEFYYQWTNKATRSLVYKKKFTLSLVVLLRHLAYIYHPVCILHIWYSAVQVEHRFKNIDS